MHVISKVGIISKPGVDAAANLVPRLIEWLRSRDIELRFDEQTAAYANQKGGLPRSEVPDGSHLIIVLGGDGTLLSAARAISGRDIPLFAVNLGGLGFLTAITIEEVFTELERAVRGELEISVRRMLQCEVWRGAQQVGHFEALNDVVVTKAALARVIDLAIYVDNHLVCVYKADGLIVATPTGSTAYSLSAGGPIIAPGVSALCVTPICPHMLTNRPVIVADESVIRIDSRTESEGAFLTIDGQVGEPLKFGDQVVCRRSPKCLRLVKPPRMMFFDVLREKLSWGER